MPAGFELLRDLRVDEIMQDIQDVRNLPGDLMFLGRLAQVPARNSQLVAKWMERVQIADFIATDAKAPLYKNGRFTLETNVLGKMKIGTIFTEEDMEELNDLTMNADLMDPQGVLRGDMVNRVVAKQLLGIRWRQESLAVAMAIDGFSYNRLGISMSGVTWGMPTDLKSTVATPWQANPTTATPITNILQMRQLRRERYGKETNRITMGTSVLRAIIATTEFSNMIRMFLAPNVSYANLPQVNSEYQRGLVGQLLDMEVVLYDSRYWSEDDAGNYTSARFLPLTPQAAVVLDDKAADRNGSIQDFGIGVAMESKAAGGLPNSGGVNRMAAGVNRAFSYTYLPPNLDPPNLTIYSAMKGFPRKYDRAATSVLFVGPVVDTIPVSDITPN
jgi:hypothetical protein